MGATRGRLLIVAIGALAVVLVAAWALAGARPRTAEERDAEGRGLLTALNVSATVVASSLLATSAEADFGLKDGIRPVRVRIVDDLTLAVRIDPARDVTLARTPAACLAHTDWSPDDAGLESRCWGEPDIAGAIAAALPTDSAGHVTLRRDHPISLTATLHRGDARCDYAPGTWMLDLGADPIVDGTPVTGLAGIAVPLAVPVSGAGEVLRLVLTGTRFCSSADSIYRQQGEPPVAP
jgi:hypothetical protein